MAYPTYPSSISFSELNVQLGHSSTASLSLGQAGLEEFSRPIGQEISICEFYTNGCPNESAYPFNVNANQNDVIGESVAVTWTAAGALPFTFSHHLVWVKVDSGLWFVGSPNVTGTFWEDSTQPNHNLYYRVQAIGTGGEKIPLDADMDNLPTYPQTYPPTATEHTQDNTPTTV